MINVITKSADERSIGGSVSASFGQRSTADSGVEMNGRKDRLGYYFSGGYQGFNGIPAGHDAYLNNAYSKLTYELPNGGQLWGTFNYSHANRVNLFLPLYDWRQDQRTSHLYAGLGLRSKLTERLELEITGRHAYRATDTYDRFINDGSFMTNPRISRDKVYGGSAKLVWRGDNNLLVGGIDYDHASIASTATVQAPTESVERHLERWGVYLNDTITIGRLAITPGFRVDKSNINATQFSPSLGATYSLGEKTVLRAYTAKGYSLWAVTLDTTPVPEKVWTTQVGVESTLVPFLWQKLTLFRNEIWDVGTTYDRQIALGTEYEIRTTPVFNTSVGAGYTFTDTRLAGTSTQIYSIPRHTVQLALRYDDKKYRAQLTGRHIFWNSNPLYNGQYQGMIWDLHLGALVYQRENSSLELFFSGHNLSDCSQSTDELLPSPGRWFGGGMRWRF